MSREHSVSSKSVAEALSKSPKWETTCNCSCKSDPVNHPKHYTYGKYEVIDVIEDWKLDYHLGNAIKYIARAGRKGSLEEDLRKAIWYINRRLEKIPNSKQCDWHPLEGLPTGEFGKATVYEGGAK